MDFSCLALNNVNLQNCDLDVKDLKIIKWDYFLIFFATNIKFVFREFNIEGFVSQYLLDSLSTDGATFVFVRESSENFPVWFSS